MAANQLAYNDADMVGPWQERLHLHCTSHGLRAPLYSIASDRRGGRTAWSCSVDVQGQMFNARFWYEGTWVGNAKEDCAQVAIEHFSGVSQAPTHRPAPMYQHQPPQQQQQAQAQQQQQRQTQQQAQAQPQQGHQMFAWQGYAAH